MESNLNIRSNVYLMPTDFKSIEFFPRDINETHGKFVKQIRDKKMLDKVPKKLIKKYATKFQKGEFGVCGTHPERKMTFGPIKKGNGVVYGCRCDYKNKCRNRIVAKQHCSKCSRFKD